MANSNDMNVVELVNRFRSEEACRAYLEKQRWPNGIACPRCGSTSISRIQERGQLDCNSCRYRFSVTSGTIFHDSHLPLWKWFLTAYIMIESKKGVSANQIKRTIDVSYKTAWYLCHRIRAAMQDAYPLPLRGIVEVDETYVGGKVRGKGKGYLGNKGIVVGAVQRGGKIILQVVPSNDKATLQGFVTKNTAPELEAIYTAEHPSYRGIGDGDTRHETVQHRAEEWVRGDVHTNAVENVWSLFKRSIMGSFHKVSLKHLDAYLDELEWRFNNRDNPYLFRDTLVKLISREAVQYKNLTA